MHKQAINHKQAIIGGGYLFTENACCDWLVLVDMAKVKMGKNAKAYVDTKVKLVKSVHIASS